MQIEGACHCGAISFTADIDPSQVILCHCSDCQILSGSPFRHVVPAPIESVRINGEPKRYVKIAASGQPRVQAFCPECGTPIYASAPDHPTAIAFRLGCVRQRDQLRPTSQIWYHSAMPWLGDLPSVPRSPEQQAMNHASPGQGAADQGSA